MNIRDLKYLVALADHMHFGKAAKASFVSQPALSIQIKKLEDVLGIKLLERTNKSVLFTDEGKQVTMKAREILDQVDAMYALAKAAKDPFSGDMKIGIFPTLAPYLLPRIMPSLIKAFPHLTFYLYEEQTATLIEKLKQGQLHAAFLSCPVSEPSFHYDFLFEEEFLLALPKSHPLSKQKSINKQDLQNTNLLLLNEGHCMREQSLSFCHKMKTGENQAFRGTSLETLRHMVAAGNGLTLMPKLACDDNKQIAYVPFAAPKPMRAICLAWRSSSAKQVVLKALGAQIRKAIK